MKRLLVLLVVFIVFWPLQVTAQGLLGILRGYHEGVSARQQEDYRDQRLRLMQEEETRIRAEREYLESLRRQIDKSAAPAPTPTREEAFRYFATHVKPKVVRIHPDFDDIMKDSGYWKWAEEQPQALKRAALDSSDPSDIIWAIGEYKKAKNPLSKYTNEELLRMLESK
jgi:hypothetical protein